MNKGILYALGAYLFWGLHPIYWKQLQHIPAVEIVSHRVLWSLVFFGIILSIRGEWKTLFEKIRSSNRKVLLFLPALLIGSNWALYIWAVNANFVVETSLGYFICPLISVFLGVLFLGEKMRKLQWISILLAGIGVLTMTFIYGNFPWISLYLACTWAVYGLLRKKSPLNPVEGLTLETTILSLFAFSYITFQLFDGSSSFFLDTETSLLLIGSGLTSGLPLLVFIAGARLINLSLIGVLQYIYPTLIFLVGVFIYGEVLDEAKIMGFIFIWAALIIFSLEGTYRLRSKLFSLGAR